MPYLNKLLSYNPVFYWIGPYNSGPVNIFSAGLAEGFPYAQGTLMAWLSKDDWGAAELQFAGKFGNADPYAEITLLKSAANTLTFSYAAGGSSRSQSGAVGGTDWIPAFFQWDVASQTIWAKINFGAKTSLTWGGMVQLPTLSLANLLSTFTGQLQYIALYDTLLADAVLSDLEVMVADVGKSVFTLIDYDSEKTAVQIHHVALTAGNFAATETLLDSLRDAMAAITLGNMAKTEYGNVDLLSVTPASDEQAQREAKWLVSYHDTTSLKSYSVEIGTADFDQLDPNDRKHAHIGDAGLVDAFITAFEAVAKSPTGGAVVVDEITLVGRNV